jgi:hypothetical protein
MRKLNAHKCAIDSRDCEQRELLRFVNVVKFRGRHYVGRGKPRPYKKRKDGDVKSPLQAAENLAGFLRVILGGARRVNS